MLYLVSYDISCHYGNDSTNNTPFGYVCKYCHGGLKFG